MSISGSLCVSASVPEAHAILECAVSHHVVVVAVTEVPAEKCALRRFLHMDVLTTRSTAKEHQLSVEVAEMRTVMLIIII